MSPRPRAVLVKPIRDRAEQEPIGGPGTFVQPLTPMDGQQLVPAGNGFDFIFEGQLNATLIVVDVPAEVDARVLVNRRIIIGIDDGQGLQLAMPMGTEDGSLSTRVDHVQVVGTNNSASAVDVRAWMVSAR